MSTASHVVRGESIQARIAAFSSDVVCGLLALMPPDFRMIRGFCGAYREFH
ncbi:hypothetical protein [Pseudomonas sp. BN102]|uniref:hypothetical protein n=1 Tax=Pseudomonas sp. BN102 TaxID=2567886 RepID=UPI002454527F|nr:hypothetical protein [Pseudomonas sp. BN102]